MFGKHPQPRRPAPAPKPQSDARRKVAQTLAARSVGSGGYRY